MFLPFENLIYHTSLSREEIFERLSKQVESENFFRLVSLFNKKHKTYEGNIQNGSFTISRILGYRNNFSPIIKGRTTNDANGSTIHIKMRMHIFVIVFMVLWLGVAGSICIAILIFSNQTGFDTNFLFPIGMFIAGYILMTGGFKYESNKSKKYLAKLFETEPKQINVFFK